MAISFQASAPRGVQSQVIQQAPQRGSTKGNPLGALVGLGIGATTGNWVPFASSVLGSAGGQAVGAATGGDTQQQSTTSTPAAGSEKDGAQPEPKQGVQGLQNEVPQLGGVDLGHVLPLLQNPEIMRLLYQQGLGMSALGAPQMQASGLYDPRSLQNVQPFAYPQQQPPQF